MGQPYDKLCACAFSKLRLLIKMDTKEANTYKQWNMNSIYI